MDRVKYTDSTNLTVGALLNSTNRVEAPFIRVNIGGYTFGVFERRTHGTASSGYYTNVSEKYPNYIQSMEVKKINGTVNQYTINLVYPVTADNDPNFIEKVLSNVQSTRLMDISYGDFQLPEYIYKDEEAIITGVKENIDIKNNTISYTISATSTATLTLSGCYNFEAKTVQPSAEIYNILYVENNKYHLLDVFTGMRDQALVRQMGLIDGDDMAGVSIPTCTGISALEYISMLVNYMTPVSNNQNQKSVYCLTTYEDTTGVLGGPYFQVKKVQKNSNSINQVTTYIVDVGYPTANIVTGFTLKNTDNWSIYYQYNKDLGNSDYIKKIDDKGKIQYEYSPQLTNNNYFTDAKDLQWWNKVTEFPIQAELTIKGLLKPAILMTYIKLNVWMYGRKHISSGYYIISSQVDKIDMSNGYTTTLGLIKVAADEG